MTKETYTFGEGKSWTLAFPQPIEGRKKHLIVTYALFLDNGRVAGAYAPPCKNMDSPVTPEFKIGNPLESLFIGSYKFSEIPLFGMN